MLSICQNQSTIDNNLPETNNSAHSRRKSLAAPAPLRTPHPATISAQWGRVNGEIARLLFSSVYLPQEAVDSIRQATAQGTTIFVFPRPNPLDIRYFQYAFLGHNLSQPRLIHDLVPPGQWPLGSLFRRRQAETQDGLAILRQRTRDRQNSALILIDKNSTNGNSPISYQSALPYLQALIEIQPQLEQPILFVPLDIIWDRKPVRPMPSPHGFIEKMFGAPDAPGMFRQTWQTFHYPHYRLAIVGEPLRLDEFLAHSSSWSLSTGSPSAAALAEELLARLEAEHRVRMGPRRVHPMDFRHQILASPALKSAMEKQATREKKPLEEIRLQSDEKLKHMQATMTSRGLLRLRWIVRQIWKKIFSGYEVDEAGLAKAKQAGKKGPMLFVPTHRSHVDYLILSDLCGERDLVPPHIAAGENLSFWPLGYLFRTAGAFFLRRQSKGDHLYSLLLKEYVSALIKEGHSVEIFSEGGRSRNGQVLPPKLGLLSFIADIAVGEDMPPIQIIPVSIGYERVIELESYVRELLGQPKQPESIHGILKSIAVLRSDYGYINVQFADPIDMRAFLKAQGYTSPSASPGVRRQSIRILGNRCHEAASQVTAITPTTLTAASLLASGTLRIHREALLRTMELFGNVAQSVGARFTEEMWKEGKLQAKDCADYALAFLIQDKAVARLGEMPNVVYLAEGEARIRLEYYKNHMVQHLLEHALMVLALRSLTAQAMDGTIHSAKLEQATRWVYQLLKPHFIHLMNETEEAMVVRGQQHLLDLGAIKAEADNCYRIMVEKQDELNLLAGVIESIPETYRAVAKIALEFSAKPLPRQLLEKEIMKQILHLPTINMTHRFESCQLPLVRAALDSLCDAGILVSKAVEAEGEACIVPAQDDATSLQEFIQRCETLLTASLNTTTH